MVPLIPAATRPETPNGFPAKVDMPLPAGESKVPPAKLNSVALGLSVLLNSIPSSLVLSRLISTMAASTKTCFLFTSSFSIIDLKRS